MFLDFYRLREQPFGVTPDPRFLYFSPGHREALASLFYGIETGRGFLSLVAEPGMGKTTLLFQLLKRWKGYVHSAFLFQTQCDSRELLRYLMEDLGLDSQDRDIVRMHADLNDFLFRETKAGKRVVLFIDESQNLSDSVLETVRLLSDFEAPDRKLLQIVLAGQPELEQRLARPGLTQLEQRIAVRARLEPLPRAEVLRYMNHRLRVAGYQGMELFTPEAAAAIAERSRGIPRLVNHLCFNALSLGCAMRSRQIGPEIVREAAGDLSVDSRPAKQQPTSARVATPRPQRQVAHAPAPSFTSTSLSSWMKGLLPHQRVLQTSFLALLLLSLAVYLGTRAGAGTFEKEHANEVSSTYVPASAGQKHAAEAPVATAYDELQPSGLRQSDERQDSSNVFTYVVQPNDTLRALCLSLVGRYDVTVQQEIRKLNPNLKDLTNLKAGQEIRLPLAPSKPNQDHLKNAR
jgi:type II secretory pathway predicted ATPase ExeA